MCQKLAKKPQLQSIIKKIQLPFNKGVLCTLLLEGIQITLPKNHLK